MARIARSETLWRFGRSSTISLCQPGAELVERAQMPENKQRLRDHAQRAIEFGIFGAPSFVVGEELLWGNDRVEDALAWRGRMPEPDARQILPGAVTFDRMRR